MIDWKVVHEELKGIANARGALDRQEARWLRAAEDVQIWTHFGMVSALDYVERTLGYGPHAANERLRVARELGALPLIEGALDRGELHWSAVRELTRVAVESTQQAWLEATAKHSLREIEEMVSGRKKGDLPGDPAEPSLRKERIVLEVSAETFARWREVRATLSDEAGRRLDDDALVSAMCEATIGEDDGREPSGRAKFQIAVVVCEVCERAWQEGGGVRVPIDDAAIERAHCDAQHLGSLDGAQPERATQDIPPAVRRFVWRRDGGCCRVPGCRSARGLEAHHIWPRRDGGDHDPSLIVLLCSACHRSHHRGDLVISGTAKVLIVTRPNDPDAPPPPSPTGPNSARAEIKQCLVGMGFAPKLAIAAADVACARAAPDASLEWLLREALRACPRPSSSTTG